MFSFDRVGEPGNIILGPKVERSELVEEVIRYVQHRKTEFPKLSREEVVVLEIEVQHKLFRISKTKGWTAIEMGAIERALISWEKELLELKNP